MSIIDISDELYDQNKFGYFASPIFHVRLRKMTESQHQAPPHPRRQRRWMEKQLGCKHADFMSFLRKIADANGFAYVPCGNGECITFEVDDFKQSIN